MFYVFMGVFGHAHLFFGKEYLDNVLVNESSLKLYAALVMHVQYTFFVYKKQLYKKPRLRKARK